MTDSTGRSSSDPLHAVAVEPYKPPVEVSQKRRPSVKGMLFVAVIVGAVVLFALSATMSVILFGGVRSGPPRIHEEVVDLETESGN